VGAREKKGRGPGGRVEVGEEVGRDKLMVAERSRIRKAAEMAVFQVG
jgi:hypothetical protein